MKQYKNIYIYIYTLHKVVYTCIGLYNDKP